MILKYLKNEFHIIRWENNDKLYSKNDLPCVHKIMFNNSYTIYEWYNLDYIHRDNDLIASVSYITNKINKSSHYYKYGVMNRYTGYVEFHNNKKFLSRRYCKFIKGICFKRLQEQLND